MKRTIYILLAIFLGSLAFQGCDTLKEDVAPQLPQSTPTLYTTVKDEAIINLLTIDEYKNATTFRIAQQPKHGSVRFLQQATLAYTPSLSAPTNQSDYFLLDVTQNYTKRTDSIIVRTVSEDEIPCMGVKTRPDYAQTFAGIPVFKLVLLNDQACEGQLNHASLMITQMPLHGTATINSDHAIKYTPEQGFTGTEYILYKVCTQTGTCGEGYLKVTVASCQQPIILRNDTITYKTTSSFDSIYQNGIEMPILDNDTICMNRSEFALYIPNKPSGIVETIRGIKYTPSEGFKGTVTFDYYIYQRQTQLLLGSATVFIKIE